MAGGRRKGGNKAKAKSQLSLGDLVLAKVKGFPAWPAKVFLSFCFYFSSFFFLFNCLMMILFDAPM